MAPAATKTRRFPPKARPRVRQINDSVFEDNCMLERNLFSQRKRARPEQQNEASPPTKKRKASPSSELPPAFYDNLSKQSLTKRALRELNRRNSQVSLRTPRSGHKVLDTTSEREKVEALRSRDTSTSRELKLFSRHGGPDLSDLRSVRLQSFAAFFRS
jgi:hypothetical protein